MKRTKSIFRLSAVALITSSLALASCGKKDKDKEGGKGKDKNTVTFKKGGVEIKSGESVKLPDDWPDDIPTPADSTIKTSQKLGALGTNLIIHSKQSGLDVISYYKEKMPADGWEESSSLDVPNGGIVTFSKGDRSVTINAASSPDNPTTVSIQLTTKKQ